MVDAILKVFRGDKSGGKDVEFKVPVFFLRGLDAQGRGIRHFQGDHFERLHEGSVRRHLGQRSRDPEMASIPRQVRPGGGQERYLRRHRLCRQPGHGPGPQAVRRRRLV